MQKWYWDWNKPPEHWARALSYALGVSKFFMERAVVKNSVGIIWFEVGSYSTLFKETKGFEIPPSPQFPPKNIQTKFWDIIFFLVLLKDSVIIRLGKSNHHQHPPPPPRPLSYAICSLFTYSMCCWENVCMLYFYFPKIWRELRWVFRGMLTGVLN